MASEEDEIERLRESYKKVEEGKKRFHFYTARGFRFPLIWTFFFAVVGIIVQSIKDKSLVFIDFFGKNYLAWFDSFGDFSSAYQVSGADEILRMIGMSWYYFLFTGGLVSLIWEFVYWIAHTEMKSPTEKNEFRPGNV